MKKVERLSAKLSVFLMVLLLTSCTTIGDVGDDARFCDEYVVVCIDEGDYLNDDAAKATLSNNKKAAKWCKKGC